MKVVLVDSTRTFGGAFELALTLAESIGAMPGQAAVLVSSQPPAVLDSRVPSHVTRYFLDRPDWIRFRLGGWAGCFILTLCNLLLRELPAAFRLALIARKEKADLIHLNNLLNSQLFGVLAARLAGVPCVCSHREYEYDSKLVRLIERLAAHHIACSRLIGANLRSLGVAPDKITYLWDGVDTAKFSAQAPSADLRELFGVPAGSKVVSIFGRLVEWKGQDVFLRAAAQVLRAVPGVHFMIVGGVSDGPADYEHTLKNLAQELDLAAHTTFTGYRSDTAALMRASTVVVHASTRPEPFGTVVLEALACGCACVAMDQGGPAEIVEDEVSGLLAPPNDAPALARAIVRILESDDFRAALGKAARARIERHFSAQVFALQHVELYRRLAQ